MSADKNTKSCYGCNGTGYKLVHCNPTVYVKCTVCYGTGKIKSQKKNTKTINETNRL